MGWVKSGFGRLIDAGEAESRAGRALLEERYRALQRQIPVLYTVVLANFLGLWLATGGRTTSAFGPVTLPVGLVCLRLGHWLRVRHRALPPERILAELRKTWFYALVISVGFCVWGLYLIEEVKSPIELYVIFFASFAALGCAYGVTSYPAAARLPLMLLGLPMALRAIAFRDPAHIALGVSLTMILLLILRLVGIHNRGFRAIVESRTAIADERERARRAERAAKSAKTKAKRIADTDSLTGLANRRAFLRILGRHAARLDRAGNAPGFALAVVDLDGFKPINDTFGHATGDAVLQGIGSRLAAAVGADAVIARTGGDEFALLLPGIGDRNSARAAGATICAALQRPYAVDGREFRISGCCGLTLLGPGDCDVEQALIRADTSLYRAKQAGRAGAAIFSREMDEMHRRRKAIETALRLPHTRDSISLLFQPIRDLATGELRAFEALARWDDEALGRVPPSLFIPIAEQINVIEPLSDRLLAKAAREAQSWPDSIRLSFNVSTVQLCTAGAAGRILAILGEARLEPNRLQIEVTETALLADFHAARRNLTALRNSGIRIVLDDFGAGHASISYLREMQFDGVKLDGSLVAPMIESVRGRRLLKGVLDLCSSLGLPCVAEHIESEDQMILLRELGCRDGQGFFLSPPLAADAAEALASPTLTPLIAAAGRHAA
jgi:diguanylate cyclase (GGDEF)-like protein